MGRNLSVESLNISKNLITNASHPSIKLMIESNENLLELYLHWNSIKGLGGVEIFKAMLTNKTLKVLDFSHNLLGNGNVITPILC
jgi:Ran GTPase-activating protein (RanGAP) involved in mRNA processing and transport